MMRNTPDVTRSEATCKKTTVTGRSDTEFVLTGIVDINGSIRGKAIRRDTFEDSIERGFPITDLLLALDPVDTPITDYSDYGIRVGAPDMMLYPDLETYRDLTWRSGWKICLCSARWPDGRVCEISPRELLKKAIDRLTATGMGYEAKVAFEYEVRIFDNNKQPMSNGISYSLEEMENFEELTRRLVPAAHALGIHIDALHTEAGPGLFELNISANSALSAADNAVLLKFALKGLARSLGLRASFMAKPAVGEEGSSGHIHFSCWQRNINAFARTQGSGKMVPDPMAWAIAGILKHLPAASLLLNPNINSYKRVIPGWFAPVNVSWGIENRSVAIRAILNENADLCRIECRRSGADANPYLALAGLIVAASDGLKERMNPPDQIRGDAYGREDLIRLPASLESAVMAFEQNDEYRKLLGEEFSAYFLTSRKWELKAWQNTVSEWELNRYDGAI